MRTASITLLSLLAVAATAADHHVGRPEHHALLRARREREFGKRQMHTSVSATLSSSTTSTSSTTPSPSVAVKIPAQGAARPSSDDRDHGEASPESSIRHEVSAAPLSAPRVTASTEDATSLSPPVIVVTTSPSSPKSSSVQTVPPPLIKVTSSSPPTLSSRSLPAPVAFSSTISHPPLVPSVDSDGVPGVRPIIVSATTVSSSSPVPLGPHVVPAPSVSSSSLAPDIVIPALGHPLTASNSASVTGSRPVAPIRVPGPSKGVAPTAAEPMIIISAASVSAVRAVGAPVLQSVASIVQSAATKAAVSPLSVPSVPSPSVASTLPVTSKSSVASISSTRLNSVPVLSSTEAATPVVTTSSPPAISPAPASPTSGTSTSKKPLLPGAGAAAAQASSVQAIYGQVQTASLLVAPEPTPSSTSTKTGTSTADEVITSTKSSSTSHTTPSSTVPQSWPAKIVPPTNPIASGDSGLASLLLSPGLSYGWLLDNGDAASQIFAFMPSLISSALGVTASQVQSVAILPYASNNKTLAIWTGYLPSGSMAALQSQVSDRSSLLYNSGSPLQRQLAAQLDPSLPVSAVGGSASGAQAAMAMQAGTEGSKASGSTHQTTAVAVASSFGAAVLLLGTLVTLRARHLRKRTVVGSGPVRLPGPEEMRESRFSTMSSASSGSTASGQSAREDEFDWANLGSDTARRTSNPAGTRKIRSGRVSISRPTLQANSLMM